VPASIPKLSHRETGPPRRVRGGLTYLSAETLAEIGAPGNPQWNVTDAWNGLSLLALQRRGLIEVASRCTCQHGTDAHHLQAVVCLTDAGRRYLTDYLEHRP
jgi:hypothetical protein